MSTTQTLEYNKNTSRITLSEYIDGFLENEVDVTTAVLTLAMEKIYDDNGLDEGDEVIITKKNRLNTITKFRLKEKK